MPTQAKNGTPSQLSLYRNCSNRQSTYASRLYQQSHPVATKFTHRKDVGG